MGSDAKGSGRSGAARPPPVELPDEPAPTTERGENDPSKSGSTAAATPDTSELVFGKYELGKRLAVGGMAEVFLATQKGLRGFERPVILKRLLADLAEQEGFIDEFIDEARVAALLNHPNVVAIYDVGESNGTYFLAMEYIRGFDLAQVQKKCAARSAPMPTLVAARIIHDAALGLDHAHTSKDGAGKPLNVVHRDVNPRNIMVREDGVTKVVDFGIARASNRLGRTLSGSVKGTYGYFAPEQLTGAEATALSDQFSLGTVFWELLTGRRLFVGDNNMATLTRALEAPIYRPSSVNPRVPPTIDDVVMKMLDREPTRRYPGCAAVANAIEKALVAQPGWSATGAAAVGSFLRLLSGEPPTQPDLAPVRAGTPARPIEPHAPRASQTPHTPHGAHVPAPAEPAQRTPARPVELPPASPPVELPRTPPLGLPLAPPRPVELDALLARDAELRRKGEPDEENSETAATIKLLLLTAAFVALVIGGYAYFKPRRAPVVLPPRATARLDAGKAALADAGTALANAPVPQPTASPTPDESAPEPPAADAATERGTYRLDTRPLGAVLWLDGRPLGPAPRVVELSAGPPHIVVADLAGYQRSQVTLWPRAGEDAKIVIALDALPKGAPVPPPIAPRPPPGKLTVKTFPAGSFINIDGMQIGLSPLTVPIDPNKNHEVQAFYSGFITGSSQVSLGPGEERTLELVLVPLGR